MRERSNISGIRNTSEFPPEITLTTVESLIVSFNKSNAHKDRTPAGSIIIPFSLYICKILEQTCPSSTSKTESKLSFNKGKFKSPTRFTDAPSTKLLIVSSLYGLPTDNALVKDGAPVGSTPIIFVLGLIWRNTVDTPAPNPPPPIGIIR